MENTHSTDEMLFAAIKANDYVSYNHLFTRYYTRLCKYVYSLLMNKNDTEDVIQELFLQLWNNRHKIEIKESVSGYLYKMARNSALNDIKAKVNYQHHLENQKEISVSFYEDNKVETDEFRIALFDCIDQLPARSREVLILHRIKGLKQKEIGEQLSISVKTIKNQIWISLQRLRTCLEIKEIKI